MPQRRSGPARGEGRTTLLVAPHDNAISQRLADALVDVERLFASELSSSLDCVDELVVHIEQYRGKMLRPTLVLVSGMATSADGESLTGAHCTLAGVVEMVHMATLVHDDVLDEAQVRRGGKTVNDLRGNETAVMLGDYLISHAYHLCSNMDSPMPAQVISAATNQVCEGELHQLANRENWSLDEQTYYQIIRDKTACLCGTCCRLSALLHDAPATVADQLYNYGEKLGLAFQIVDDVLDLTGSEDTVGKTLGLDLRKGKLTLPLIHLLQHGSPQIGDRLRSLLKKDDAIQEIRAMIAEHDAVGYATGVAADLIDQAKRSLDAVPDSPARGLLAEMADAVLTRKL